MAKTNKQLLAVGGVHSAESTFATLASRGITFKYNGGSIAEEHGVSGIASVLVQLPADAEIVCTIKGKDEHGKGGQKVSMNPGQLRTMLADLGCKLPAIQEPVEDTARETATV